MDLLSKNSDDAIKEIINFQKNTPTKNTNLFFLLYMLSFESKKNLPENSIGLFPLLKKTIPMNRYQMQHELVLFVIWYNIHRPHSAFLKYQNKCEPMGAMTPDEVYNGLRSPPQKSVEYRNNSEIPRIQINIFYFEGRKHLPIIEIEEACPKLQQAA